MTRFRRGLLLLAKSWGWDLDTIAEVDQSERDPDQKWQNWGVRCVYMFVCVF
jgi:hypothetical protein